jgi:hypothetical protein
VKKKDLAVIAVVLTLVVLAAAIIVYVNPVEAQAPPKPLSGNRIWI